MANNDFKKGDIAIYKKPQGPEIRVRLEKDTMWLDGHLKAKLFGVNRPGVVKDIIISSKNWANSKTWVIL